MSVSEEELAGIRQANLERIKAERAKRRAELSENQMVKRAIPRLDKDIVKEIKKSAGGRKKRYTPTKMKNSINSYFDWCESEDEVPSIKGMMIHLKMYRDQFYTYCSYPEFKDMMEHARLIISNWVETDIYTSKGLAAGKIAYAKNVLDWTEKSEINQTSTQTVITVDQARAKIEMLAPKLLELLKSNNIVNQITHREDKVIEAEKVVDIKRKRVV